jgi:hypothetical protein
MKAFETNATLDPDGRLHLESALSRHLPKNLRVIVLVPEDDEDSGEWYRAAATNEAFDFLADPAEDIYTLADGKAFHDAR